MGYGEIKKTALYTGVAVTVYLMIKYILPLAAPFIVAFLFAVLFEPVVRFLCGRLKLKRCFAVIIVMLAAGGIIFSLVWWFGSILLRQLRNIVANYELYCQYLDNKICDVCICVDGWCGFNSGTLQGYVDEGLKNFAARASDKMMPSLMGNSISAVKGMVAFFGLLVIFFMALFFISKDYGQLCQLCKRQGWLSEAGGKIYKMLVCFFRTQGIIMSVTMVITSISMIIIKNPYWLILGVVLGIVDALPIFGTGTVLVPWALFKLISGDFAGGAVLVATTLICYFVREYLEPRLMGKELGIHPLFMLVSVYSGLVLFGILGVITGPIMFIVTKEIIAGINLNK